MRSLSSPDFASNKFAQPTPEAHSLVTDEDRVKFGLVVDARRVWAIGAIHGSKSNLAELHTLLETHFRPGDRLVYLGNYLGRGEAIIDTVNELLLFRRAMLARFNLVDDDILYLRGSQEEMWQKLTQLQIAQNPAQVLEWMFAQGVDATLEAYGVSRERARMRCREGPLALARWSVELRQAVRSHPGHEQLLSSLRRAAFTDTGTILFVHAGVDTSRPLSAQSDSFWWGAGRFDDISEPYQGFSRIVRGRDPDRGGTTIGAISATIDSGCGFGGELTATCFDSNGKVVKTLEA